MASQGALPNAFPSAKVRGVRAVRPFLMILWLLLGAGIHAPRAAEPTRYLVADGRQQLHLPVRLFEGLTEATFEGWIRFDEFGNYSRFFDVGRRNHSINLTHYERSPNVLFEVWEGSTNRAALHVSGLLRSNEWAHVAAVLGHRGMRLYFNGLLVASNSVPIGFAELRSPGDARLLRGSWDDSNASLNGGIADVRLYRGARSGENILKDLEHGPTRGESGLVAAWPFDGTLDDIVTGRALRSSSQPWYATFERPSADTLAHPAIVSGELRAADGHPVNLAHVRVRTRDGRVVAAGRTGTDGSPDSHDVAGPGVFRMAVYDTSEPIRLEVTHPSGRVSTPPIRLVAGEIHPLPLVLPPRPPSAESTNQFVRMLMADLGLGEPWLREMAANDLAALGPFPQAAAALAGSLPFEQDPAVRQRIAFSLRSLTSQSPIAIAALLEDNGANPTMDTERLQAMIRQRPVPAVLRSVYTRRTQAIALLFAGIFGSFALLHFFFFLCERRNRTDGIYALFTGTGAAGMLVTEWTRGSADGWKLWMGPSLLALSYLYGLWMVYSVFTHRVPRRFWVIGGVYVLATLRILLGSHTGGVPGWLQVLVLFISFAVVIEMLRVAWQAYRARKPGSRLIGGGIVFFFVCQFLAPLEATIFFDDIQSAWLFPVGMSAFVASASLHLARQFVNTNRALREANVAIARSQAQLHREVAEAEAYLRSLLPAKLETSPVRTDWTFQPSTQLGGDAFGYHWIDGDRMAIYLLDVCGHGVGAALLAVSALNTLRSTQFAGAGYADPVAVLGELNRAFPMEAHHNQYFSAWYGIFDRRDRSLRFASAGHPPSYLFVGDRPLEPLRTEGPPIGCRAESHFNGGRTQVPPGALLMVISDGVYEVARADGSAVTLRQFEAELEKSRWKNPSDVLEWARLTNGNRPLDDDFSVLHVRFE